MKKISSALQTVIFFSCAITSGAMAQQIHPDLAMATSKEKMGVFDNSAEKSSSKNAAVSTEKMEYKEAKMLLKNSASQVKTLRANVKALTYMAPRFSEAAMQPTWSYKHRLMVATIQQGDVSIEVAFTKRARWLHTLKTYDPSMLPADVSKLIVLKYPSTKMIAARELKERDETYMSYFVRLEDEGGYKDVVVYNGETSVYNTVKK